MFELKQALNLKLQQQLVMTPQLQQAIRLLQLSRLELVDAIHAELEQNPALEEDNQQNLEVIAEERSMMGGEPEPAQEAKPKEAEAEVGEQSGMQEIDWQQWLDSYNSAQSPGPRVKKASTDDLPSLEQTLSHEDTLQEHLMAQLSLLNLVDQDKQIAADIVGAIDDGGLLRGERPLEDIAIRLEVSVDHVQRVLEMVQTLDPAGVAARSIQESLLIQLKRCEDPDPLAEKILTDFMAELEKRNFQAISKALDTPLEEIGRALRAIQKLDPRPARNFGGSNSVYITPDIYVHRIGDDYQILLNEDGLPMLRVSNYYKQALSDGMNGDAKNYVQDKLRAAQWLIRSIHQRQRTIYRVMESILKFQREFFDKGITHLKPLILRDVAEDIDMHESTISRVTSSKYVHTPQGIFELKYFFNSSIGKSDGDDVASVSVKHRIKQLIEAEDANRPLSDQALVNLLKKEEISIARRTVAKYREAMNILSSSKRKKIL